ncbi:MAG: C40 family peptidase [Alphaproteobacteria bacterium]
MSLGAPDREKWIRGQTSDLDPRTTPARPDVAFEGLKGKIEAIRFTRGKVMTISNPITDLRNGPRNSEGLLTQALLGEQFRVLDRHAGWAFGQLLTDGYVGYLQEKHLASHYPEANYRVSVPLTHVYPVPDLKTPVRMALPFGAKLCANPDDAREGFAEVKGLGWVYAKHLVALGRRDEDFVKTAKSFLMSPYLWGGRSALGLDCSALVQLALMAAGVPCPRDTDQQQKVIGHSISNVPEVAMARAGDLVFFPGHVGFLVAENKLLHANAYHMRVTIDDVNEVAERVKKDHPTGIIDIRRLKIRS